VFESLVFFRLIPGTLKIFVAGMVFKDFVILDRHAHFPGTLPRDLVGTVSLAAFEDFYGPFAAHFHLGRKLERNDYLAFLLRCAFKIVVTNNEDHMSLSLTKKE